MKNNKTFTILLGILLIVTSLFIFMNPGLTLASIAWVFAINLLASGIVEVIAHFSLEADDRNSWIVADGIISVLLGLVLLSSSWIGLASLIPTFFALWTLFTSITRTMIGFRLNKVIKGSGTTLITLGILGILLGLFLLFHPVFSAVIIAYTIAGSFLVNGIASLVAGFSAK